MLLLSEKPCGKMSIEDDLREKLRGVEVCVRHILAHYPEARSNDKLLMLLYWEIVDRIPMTKEFKRAFLKRATHPESIRRCRQRIQSMGDYLPRKEVLEYRRARSRKFRELLKGQKTLL